MPLLLPYLKFNVQDWLNSEKVSQMTFAQRGAYMHLLCLCWSHPTCTLPHDPMRLCQMLHWEDGIAAFSPVMDCFLPVPENRDRCTNARLYQEWTDATTLMQQQSAGGKKGSRLRWKQKPLATMAPTHTDWLAALKANPLYGHVNFEVEIGKMKVWQQKPANRKRQLNESFVINWINKIERPLTNGSGQAQPPPFPPKTDPIARGQWRTAYGDPRQYGYE